MFADSLESRGKFAVIFSEEAEFVFGDGFYHTFSSTAFPPPMSPTMLIPLTPTIAVLYAKPRSYMVDPRLGTIVLRNDEVAAVNRIVQIYSENFVFFRTQKPELEPEFKERKHLVFNWSDDLVDKLVKALWST